MKLALFLKIFNFCMNVWTRRQCTGLRHRVPIPGSRPLPVTTPKYILIDNQPVGIAIL